MKKIITLLIVALFIGCSQNNKSTPISKELQDSLSKFNIDSTGRFVRKVTMKDSIEIKELKKKFKIEKDDFDPNEGTWYTPIEVSKFSIDNSIFCYFKSIKGKAENLRFKVEFYDDDLFFLKVYRFSIDGKAMEFIPEKVDRNTVHSLICESFDESANPLAKKILKEISVSKSAKIKMIGDQYFHIETISDKQKQSIKETLRLYELMGGTL